MEAIKTPEIRVAVMVSDIADLRNAIKIGDLITETVTTDKLGDKLENPKKVKHRIIGKYPHLVRVENSDGLSRRTITYVDILLMSRRQRAIIKKKKEIAES